MCSQVDVDATRAIFHTETKDILRGKSISHAVGDKVLTQCGSLVINMARENINKLCSFLFRNMILEFYT